MTAACRLGSALLLNALGPKHMMPQPDAAPQLYWSIDEPGVGPLALIKTLSSRGAYGRSRRFFGLDPAPLRRPRGASNNRPG